MSTNRYNSINIVQVFVSDPVQGAALLSAPTGGIVVGCGKGGGRGSSCFHVLQNAFSPCHIISLFKVDRKSKPDVRPIQKLLFLLAPMLPDCLTYLDFVDSLVEYLQIPCAFSDSLLNNLICGFPLFTDKTCTCNCL